MYKIIFKNYFGYLALTLCPTQSQGTIWCLGKLLRGDTPTKNQFDFDEVIEFCHKRNLKENLLVFSIYVCTHQFEEQNKLCLNFI